MATLRNFLLEALCDQRWRTCRKRREDLKGIQEVDTWATLRFTHQNWPQSRMSALKNVLCGGGFGNAVATKWSERAPDCPHCAGTPETLLHRFWHCPHWHAVRKDALGATPPMWILARAPSTTLTMGLVPIIHELQTAQLAAENEHTWTRPPQTTSTLCTDGAAIYPQDPVLRRSTWSLAWALPDGSWKTISGPTPGKQTVGRGELVGAIMAYYSNPAPPALYIDNKYVADGIREVIQGHATHLLDGTDGDLWSLLVAAAPRTIPTWMPSHRSLAEITALGLPTEAWAGNKAADTAASEAAAARTPPQHLLQLREDQLELAKGAQAVISAIQEQALDAFHSQPGGNTAQRKRVRVARAKAARISCRGKRVHTRRSRGDRPLPKPASAHGVHVIPSAADPVPSSWAKRYKGRSVPWLATCTKCGVTARGSYK